MKLCLCTGGPILCHAGRLRFRRKNAAVAATLASTSMQKIPLTADKFLGIQELINTAAPSSSSAQQPPAAQDSDIVKSATTVASLHGAAAAALSVSPWLQNLISNGCLGGLGNFTTNDQMVNGLSASLPTFTSAALGGLAQKWATPQTEGLLINLNHLTMQNFVLNEEIATLRQQLAIAQQALDKLICQHCGKPPIKGTGDGFRVSLHDELNRLQQSAHFQQAAWDAKNILASAAVASDKVRDRMMQANNQAEGLAHREGEPNNPLSTLLKTAPMWENAVLNAANGSQNLSTEFLVAIQEMINGEMNKSDGNIKAKENKRTFPWPSSTQQKAPSAEPDARNGVADGNTSKIDNAKVNDDFGEHAAKRMKA